jgi:NitT/TauT family transport system substrate-binding protein
MFTDSTLAAKPEALAKFYRAYDEAVDRMNAGEVRDYSALVAKYGFPQSVIAYLGSGVRYRSARSVTQAMFDDILAWTKDKGMTRRDWTLGQVATDEFLK